MIIILVGQLAQASSLATLKLAWKTAILLELEQQNVLI